MNIPVPIDAPAVLTREQYKIRAKLIELAAIFDRIDRAKGEVRKDSRMLEIRKSLDILISEDSESCRAERIQMIYSREFDPEWKKSLELSDH